jgi:molybdopterin biosynthesis enzyme MoaB
MLLSVCIGILPHTVLTTAASTIEEDRQSIKLMEETLAQLKQSSSSASNAYEEALAAYESAELEVIELKTTDLITTSGGNNIGKDDGKNDAEWID